MADKLSNDEMDKLLAELPSVEENVSEEKPIPKKEYINKDKPDWADKKNDDYNSYEYSDDKEEVDTEW